MKMSHNQTRGMLIVISALFGLYALTTNLGEGGTPGIGIAMAAAMVLLIISAIRSGPHPSKPDEPERTKPLGGDEPDR
jgi:hypothetical protein